MAGKIKPENVAKGCAGCYLALLLLIALLGIVAFFEGSTDAGWGGITLSILGFVVFLLFYLLFLFGKSLMQNKKTDTENQAPKARQNVVVVEDAENMAKKRTEVKTKTEKEATDKAVISQAQQIEDAAQQIIDGLGLLQKTDHWTNYSRI